MQTKRLLQRRVANGASGGPPAPPLVHDVLRTPGQPLNPTTRGFMESRFGHDFSQVRVHADALAAASARAINARAYTVGRDVVFGSGQYAPGTSAGQRLLAHELTHVVQQTDEMLLRQNGGGPAQAPAPVTPTSAQSRIIETARLAAAVRTQIAMFRVRGIVPPAPPGRPDPGARMRRRAQSLARVMFNWKNPNMAQVGQIISSMVTHLGSPRVMIAAHNDPECGNRAAYVRGLRPPIILCPHFFSGSNEQRIRTMIHESAHLAGIGNAGLSESYCIIFDCETSCGGFDSADSWAHFVHCLSGQTPDQPTVITPGTGTP